MDLPELINPNRQALTFKLVGDLDHGDFVPWMKKQADKLGISFTVGQPSIREMTLRAVGAPEMTDAFALACSLGPKSVHVESLEMLDGTGDS